MEEETKPNKWKTIAIIFIVLFVLETVFVIYVVGLGSNAVKNENTCIISCSNDGYDTYYYDDYVQLCYCYGGGEIQKTIDMS